MELSRRFDFITQHKRYLFYLLIIAGFIFLYRLDYLPLIDRDETRFSFEAKTMLDRNDWVIPFLNGKPHMLKPPFYMWLLAISFKLFGLSTFTARIVTTFLALGTVFCTYAIGNLLWNKRTGFLAGIILATCFGFFGASRTVIIDIPLTFFTTLSITLILYGLKTKNPWFYIWSYISFSAGIMTKGPVAIILPGFIFFLYLWKTKQLSRIKELKIISGIIIMAVLVIPWFVMAQIRLPWFFEFFFIREHAERFLTKVHHRSGPLYYYIPIVIIGLFPWIWFMPAALKKIKISDKFTSWWNDPSRFFVFTWFLVGFVFFTMANSKLPSYLIPYIVPVTLLIATWWDRTISGENNTFGITSFSIITLLLGIGLLVAGFAFPLDKFNPKIQPLLGWPMWPEAILLILMGILPFVFSKMKKVSWSFAAIAICNVLLMFHLALYDEGPKAVASHSTPAICQKLDSLLQPDDNMLVYHEHHWSVSVYLQSKNPVKYVDTLEEIAKVLNQPGKTYVVLEEPEDLQKLQPQVSTPLHTIMNEGTQLLISN